MRTALRDSGSVDGEAYVVRVSPAAVHTLGLVVGFCITSIFSLATTTHALPQAFPPKQALTLVEASALVDRLQGRTAVPLVVDDRVVHYMNQYLISRSGRARLQSGLQQVGTYRALIRSAAENHGTPRELWAVAFVESGIKNSREKISNKNLAHASLKSNGAAGLWQLTPATARSFGLVVNDNIDDRLSPEKSTQAAMLYFKKLFHQFNDWHLVIAAYNKGAKTLENQLSKHHTHDVWILDNLPGSRHYVSQVMAAIILLTPTLLDSN